MPTNDERREIAARLRELSEGALDSREYEHRAICAVVGCWGDGEYSGMELKDRLADLIEPEERTCRNVSKSTYSDEFDCSECGLNLDLIGSECGCGSTMAFFEGRKMVRELKEPNYCPNCGCRVKEE